MEFFDVSSLNGYRKWQPSYKIAGLPESRLKSDKSSAPSSYSSKLCLFFNIQGRQRIEVESKSEVLKERTNLVAELQLKMEKKNPDISRQHPVPGHIIPHDIIVEGHCLIVVES